MVPRWSIPCPLRLRAKSKPPSNPRNLTARAAHKSSGSWSKWRPRWTRQHPPHPSQGCLEPPRQRQTRHPRSWGHQKPWEFQDSLMIFDEFCFFEIWTYLSWFICGVFGVEGVTCCSPRHTSARVCRRITYNGVLVSRCPLKAPMATVFTRLAGKAAARMRK